MRTTKRQKWMTEYVSRLRGIVSPALHEKTVLVVGLGGGSYLAEKLARFAPKKIILYDFDVVEIGNLSRTSYTCNDVSAFKVYAMARRIESINPYIKVEYAADNICEMAADLFKLKVFGSDLVIAGTDQFKAQALLNEVTYRQNIPAVFIGIHMRGEGGRVVWTLPGVTPCYRCVARERYEWFEKHGDLAVDLVAEPGSLVDAQFVDMVALKVGIALMDRGQRSMMGRFFDQMNFRNDIIVRCDPGYGWGNALWDAVLADLPTSPKPYAKEIKEQVLFSMDTLWLRSEREPNCPICGLLGPEQHIGVR